MAFICQIFDIKRIVLLIFCFAFIKVTFCKPTSKHPTSCQKIILTQTPDSNISLWMLNVLTLLSAVLFLILLGVIKGLCGILCCAPLGMWGLGTLIDLPQPLERYQEKDLKNKTVVYDDVGWPIHPTNGKRSVRALSRKTEFCLNTVFFLTYPLAILITVCSSCWFQESEEDDNRLYQCINSITFDYSQPRKSNAEQMTKARTIITSKGIDSKNKDLYGGDDNDSEEQDTKYVKKQMRRSRASLQKN